MKFKSNKRRNYPLPATCILSATLLILAPFSGSGAQKRTTATPTSATDRNTASTFVARAKTYIKLRNGVQSKLPTLSKDSTPEQITAHKKAFGDGVRAARVSAKPGDVFVPAAGEYLRRMIRTEFKGQDRGEVKEAILEAETAGVPLKVNYPYPETKEVSAIPPTLLLKLPELPKELNYRFVGRHMLLMDKENGLIIDYLRNALP